MFDKKPAQLKHFLDFARERKARISISLVLDENAKMVQMITVTPPNGTGHPVLFEDMAMDDELTQARILHLKRTLALW